MKNRIIIFEKPDSKFPYVYKKMKELLKEKLNYDVEIVNSPIIEDKKEVKFFFIPLSERDTENSIQLTKEGIPVIVYKNYGKIV